MATPRTDTATVAMRRHGRSGSRLASSTEFSGRAAKTVAIAGFLLGAAILESPGDITLTIDLGAKTLAFTGTDSGDTESIGGEEVIRWEEAPLPTAGVNIGTLASPGFEAAFTSTVGNSLSPAASNFETRLQLSDDSNSGAAEFTFAFPAPGPLTITGTGTPIDYAAILTSDEKTFLESLAGQTISFSRGSGFSDLSVQAIPEPTALVLLVWGALGIISRRNRSHGAVS